MIWWVLALRLAGLGWYVAFCILLGAFGGLALDKLVFSDLKFPAFTLTGIILGSIAAFWGLYRMVYPLLYGGRRDGGESGERREG